MQGSAATSCHHSHTWGNRRYEPPLSWICFETLNDEIASPRGDLRATLTHALGIADLYQAVDLESGLTSSEEFQEFKRAAAQGNLVPVYERLFSDQLTPVVAYRCLVGEDDHELPSFLYESVVNGDQTVRPSCVKASRLTLRGLWAQYGALMKPNWTRMHV